MKKLLISITILVVSLNLGVAQTSSLSTDKKVTVLYDHTFPSMGHFRSSFINTSLSANLGFGLISLIRIPGIEIGEYNIGAFEGQILFFNMDVQYQQRFTPWLALFLQVRCLEGLELICPPLWQME